jgi:hypothetical protein
MERLAGNEVLRDLPFELCAVGAVASPWLSSSESPAAPVNSQPSVHRQGRIPESGLWLPWPPSE